MYHIFKFLFEPMKGLGKIREKMYSYRYINYIIKILAILSIYCILKYS